MTAPLSRSPLLPEDLDGITARVEPVARQLQQARVLILGATGFVGGWLLESLLALDQAVGLQLKVAILTRSAAAFSARAPHLATDSRLTMHEGDLTEIAALPGLAGFTHVVHAASDVNRRMTSAEALACLRTLDQGTEALLQAASGWPVHRLLYVSSAAVYDRTHGAQSDAAGQPPTPGIESTYATGKRLAELRTVLHASASGYEAVIARLGAFVGPLLPLNAGFAAGNFVGDALAGRAIRILGDGTPQRSYQYAADMAVWLWTLLLSGKAGEAYNVGGATPISLRDLAECIQQVAGGPRAEVLGTPDPTRTVDAYIPPVDKAMRELGLANQVDLGEAIRRTLFWYSIQGPRT